MQQHGFDGKPREEPHAEEERTKIREAERAAHGAGDKASGNPVEPVVSALEVDRA